jgi:hypothetical protein
VVAVELVILQQEEVVALEGVVTVVDQDLIQEMLEQQTLEVVEVEELRDLVVVVEQVVQEL